MTDRDRYRHSRRGEEEEQDQTERQAGFLTFQILMTALLLCAVWGMKALHLPVFEEIMRLSAYLEADNGSVRAVLGYEPLSAALQERFSIDLPGLLEGLRRSVEGLKEQVQFPGAESPSDAAEGAAMPEQPAMGGVYPGLLAIQDGQPRRPNNVTFSPVLLTAQPRVPVSGRVTSGFGWRENPFAAGNADFHTGLDIAAAEGTVILAALPGEVVDTGYSDSYGNYLHIAHAGGLETHYAHCSEIIAKTGEKVRAGERIALVGSTGNVTGPHLHFEIRQGGLCCDPLIQLQGEPACDL